jgi:hypothetical protein
MAVTIRRFCTQLRRLKKLRKTDQAFDAFVDGLTAALVSEAKMYEVDKTVSPAHTELIAAVAARVIHRLRETPILDRKRIEAATLAEPAPGWSFSDS